MILATIVKFASQDPEVSGALAGVLDEVNSHLPPSATRFQMQPKFALNLLNVPPFLPSEG